jgi:hypothetical protein
MDKQKTNQEIFSLIWLMDLDPNTARICRGQLSGISLAVSSSAELCRAIRGFTAFSRQNSRSKAQIDKINDATMV